MELYNETRSFELNGKTEWLWPKDDTGLWNIREELSVEQIPRIMEYVTDKRTCVQAGGAVGMAPFIYSYLFDWVYTFEPNPRNFFYLVNNVQRDNVTKINAILGETHRLAAIGDDENGSNRGIYTVRENGRVPTFTVDDLALDSCGLIHFDMEGYEEYALRGARETIDKFSPVIVGEGINGRDPCTRFLNDMGYVYKRNVVSDAIFVRETCSNQVSNP